MCCCMERRQSRRVKSKELQIQLSRVVTGMEGLIEIATLEKAEILVTAIVGMIGHASDDRSDTSRKRHCACQ